MVLIILSSILKKAGNFELALKEVSAQGCARAGLRKEQLQVLNAKSLAAIGDLGLNLLAPHIGLAATR